MYIQITDKCNMECEHCGYSCTAEGTFMSMKVFKKACEIAEEYGENIAIGGGEPTLHPKIWEIIGLSLAYSEGTPFMATNGSKTEIALKLAKLTEKEVLDVQLSRDWYHDPIDDEVVDAFLNIGRRAIRNTSESVSPNGRALETLTYTSEEFRCMADEIFIDPLGNIFACACKTISLGTVFKPDIDKLYDMDFKEEFNCPTEYEEYLKEQEEEVA